MSDLKQKYSSALIFREPTRALSEVVVGDLTDVSLHEGAITITSVSNVGGIAEFNFTPGPTLAVGQEVTISGFLVETTYNVTGIITVTSAGDFQIGIAFTGTEASVGSFIELVARVRAIIPGDAYKEMYESLYDFEADDQAPYQRDTVQTTDAATTTLLTTLVIPLNTTQLIRTRIFLRETNTDAGYIEIMATVYRAGSGDPVISAQLDDATPVINLEPTGWGATDATFSVNSPDIEINVTGVAATTIDWTAYTHLETFL